MPLSLLLAVVAVRSKSATDSIDRYLRAEMARNHIPGLAVAIIRHGHIEKMSAYGKAELEWGQLVGTDTRFELASTSKIFTGVALMKLVESGKLDLGKTIDAYLDAVPEAWRGVKLIDLATHTSGLPSAPPIDSNASASDLVEKVKPLPLDYAPGEKSDYGSSDYVVLGAIIERVTGQPLPKYLQQSVFGPAHMQDTGFDYAAEGGPIRTSHLLPHRSPIYRWDGNNQTPFGFLYPAHSYAAGGAYSSVRDLARWAAALDRGEVLNKKSVTTMWTRQRLTDGTPTQWGIGWVSRTYEGRRVVGHTGGPALSDFLHLVDEDLTVVVLQNQQRMYPYLAQGVVDLLAPPKAQRTASLRQPCPDWARKFVTGLSHGIVDHSFFAKGQEDLEGDVRNLLVPYAESLGTPESIEFIEVKDRRFVFEAAYGRKLVRWILAVDERNHLEGLDVQAP